MTEDPKSQDDLNAETMKQVLVAELDGLSIAKLCGLTVLVQGIKEGDAFVFAVSDYACYNLKDGMPGLKDLRSNLRRMLRRRK
jgi:hypothetical protein